MTTENKYEFGFSASPVGPKGATDAELYADTVATCRFGDALGYESAWMLEHHFTDYFPCPSPIVMMAHVAAHCPDLGLGTMVIVTPWHHPLRLAAELAMLRTLTSGNLHIGIGRGTAPLEYDAFNVNMEEARQRFSESYAVIDRALSGESFTHDGEFISIPREIQVRPRIDRDRINFYGAIGSPESAEIMADLGLPPLSISNFPMGLQRKIIDKWTARARERGMDESARKPIAVSCFIEDSDEKARDLAKRYFPDFYRLQAKHYEVDRDLWRNIKGYEQFSKMFANLKKLSEPDQMDPWLDLQFIGSPETIIERLEEYADIGFDHFVLNVAVPGVPLEVRHEQLERFAGEVGVRYSDRFKVPSPTAG